MSAESRRILLEAVLDDADPERQHDQHRGQAPERRAEQLAVPAPHVLFDHQFGLVDLDDHGSVPVHDRPGLGVAAVAQQEPG